MADSKQAIAGEYVWKLWDLANGVTAFAIAQAIAIAIALGSSDTLNAVVRESTGLAIMIGASLLSASAHAVAVEWCHRAARRLRAVDSPPPDVELRIEATWAEATRGRILGIAVFSLLVVGMTSTIYLAHR